MAGRADDQTQPTGAAEIERTANLLGGARVLRRQLRDPFEVHELLSSGLPREALIHLMGSVSVLHSRFLKAAIGISPRTSQRIKVASAKRLSSEQSGRAWKFAEILGKATALFGSQQEAEQWLERPAIGLDRRRPIDLLATPPGVRLVEDFLGRLEFGVYT